MFPWGSRSSQLRTTDLEPLLRKWSYFPLFVHRFQQWEQKIMEQEFWSSFSKFEFGSVTQSCLTLCDPMDCSAPDFPVHHQLLELAQTHAHGVGDAIQSSHPLLSPTPAFNLLQHQGLCWWVSSSHQVAKVLELQWIWIWTSFRSWWWTGIFHLMAAVTVCSGFGVQENQVCHCFHCFPIYLPLSDQTRCHDLGFLNVEFLANFTPLFKKV